MTTSWALDILGPFSLKVQGGERALRISRKWQGLLACLAVAGARSRSFSRLNFTIFWPMDASRCAPPSLALRASIRRSPVDQALTGLRAVADGELAAVLRVDAEMIALGSDALAVDLHHLEAALSRVLDLYRGELLEGLAISEPLFEEWLLVERQRLRQAALYALGRLLAFQCADREFDAALVTARRMVSP